MFERWRIAANARPEGPAPMIAISGDMFKFQMYTWERNVYVIDNTVSDIGKS